MEPEIGKQLAAEGLKLLQGTEKFVLTQAPDFMQQVLKWQLAINLFDAISCLTIILIAAYLDYRFAKWLCSEEGDSNTAPILIINIFLVLPIIGLSYSIPTLIEIYFAPKIFLLEYFAHLLK